MVSNSPIDQIMAQLARQMTLRTQRSAAALPQQGDAPGPGAVALRDDGLDMSVEAAVHKRIAALRASGVDEAAQLSRAVIETLLGHTFGAALMRDARFQQMIDAVHHAMTDHPQCRAMMEQVLLA